MADISDVGGVADTGNIAGQVLAQVFLGMPPDVVRDVLAAAHVQGFGGILAGLFQYLVQLAGLLGKGLHDIEEPAMPIIAGFATPMVAGMFGSDVDTAAFAKRATSGERAAAGRAMVEAFMAALSGEADGPLEPSDAGAKRIAAAGVNATLEGWFQAAVPELLSDIIPWDIGHFQAFGKLPEEVIKALGVGRLVRRALTPLVNATAVEPMKRYANAKYRPTQLTPAEVAQQLARGNLSFDDASRRLAEHGYRDEDIPAVLYQAVKFRGVAELEFLVRLGKLSRDAAVQELQDVGWTADVATSLLDVERFKRIAAFETAIADAAITAYADGRIDDSILEKYTTGTTFDEQHSAQLREQASARRALRNKPLTPAEAKACVEADILAVPDYRRALDNAGYSEFAADALELLLRKQLNEKRTAAEHKQQLADEKAAADAAKKQAAADARTRIDAARALKQRGSIATLEQAVVHGLTPIARLEEVLNAEFDSDTVAIYVADVEEKRQAYLATKQKALDAAKRAAAGGLSIGQLQAALTDRVLTIDQITPQLKAKGLSAQDIDVLERTMQETAAAKQAAALLRQQALHRTATKTLTLQQAEALTIAGHWALAQFDAFTRGHGYDVADVASLRTLVTDAIARAKKAQGIHAAATAADAGKGLNLAQFERAVVLGNKTIQAFGAFLTEQGFSADATATLVAEATAALTTARAAQQRRTAAAGAADGSAVSLADVTRAAQLGILSPAQYAAALELRGYSADDAALELDLLAAEIAAKKRPAPGDGTAEATIAAGTGTPRQTAALKHVQIDGELAAKGLSLATTEKAVKDGLLTIDGYEAWLEANGYGHADAELLRALLAAALPADVTGAPSP